MAKVPDEPASPPQLPKSTALRDSMQVLQQLQAFVDNQPDTAYQREPGWKHIAEVVRYIDWASSHQHEARRV